MHGRDTCQRPARLKSCLCSQAQLESDLFRAWVGRMGLAFTLHRKLWEFAYIAQALDEHGMLQPGRRGLGFAVGREPLAAFFAKCGCEIVATDLDETQARQLGWTTTNQHAARLEDLNPNGLCDPNEFRRLVTFRAVDMNRIPDDLGGFDFVWSSCSFEHLGSIARGKRFIQRMTHCLKPDGIAVHTTEFNVSSNTDTIDHDPSFVIFRQQDIEAMAASLRAQGRAVELDLSLGDSPADDYVDPHPYRKETHLKLQLGPYVATSFGLIVGPAGSHPSAAKTNGAPRSEVAQQWRQKSRTSSGHHAAHPTTSQVSSGASGHDLLRNGLARPMTILRSRLREGLRVLGLLPLARRLRRELACLRHGDLRLGSLRLGNLPEFKIHVRLNDDAVGAGIATYRFYEPHVTEGLRRCLKPGDCFLDIGANIGYFTLLGAALVGAHGRVLAFEPNRDNCALLTKSLRQNQFRNVRLYPYAVGAKEQTLALYRHGTSSTSILRDKSSQQAPPPGRPYGVRAVVLDDFLADLDRLDVIKIDIDGFEPRALQGMQRLIQRHRPVIFTEFCPLLLGSVGHSTAQAYLEQLLSHGYTLGILEGTAETATVPRSKQEILEAHARSGLSHLDLVAFPNRQGRTAEQQQWELAQEWAQRRRWNRLADSTIKLAGSAGSDITLFCAWASSQLAACGNRVRALWRWLAGARDGSPSSGNRA